MLQLLTWFDASLDTKDTTHSCLDVFAVRKYLLRFLPLELADLILEAAQYWARYRTSRSHDLQVIAQNDPHRTATSRYLITSPIPQLRRGDETIPTYVKMIKFHLRSCDQGWGGSRENRGLSIDDSIEMNTNPELHDRHLSGLINLVYCLNRSQCKAPPN